MMGIAVEFCPDLALRKFGSEGRFVRECLPEKLEAEKSYEFLKKGQKNYWLAGEIPLRETKGGGVLSRPVASVRIQESTQFYNGEYWTKGRYYVVEVYGINSEKIRFDGLEKI